MSNNLTQKDEGKLKITLNNAAVGTEYVITDCSLPQEIKSRFFEMGLTVGATVKVVKTAPLKDPMEITVRGYSLCIRANEAAKFLAEEKNAR